MLVSVALGIAKEIPTEGYCTGTNMCPVPVRVPCSGVLWGCTGVSTCTTPLAFSERKRERARDRQKERKRERVRDRQTERQKER